MRTVECYSVGDSDQFDSDQLLTNRSRREEAHSSRVWSQEVMGSMVIKLRSELADFSHRDEGGVKSHEGRVYK